VDKTFVIKGKPESDWILVDASKQPVGRMATRIAGYLIGKHKPTYTPGVMMGDYVVVINAALMNIPEKRLDTKMYHFISGYPSGIRSVLMRKQMQTHPERVIRAAVWGMLPHNKVGRELINRLKIYPGAEHPHAAQHPKAEVKELE